MNGIIFDIKKYAIHDGPGIRTTVFMKGCPLSCLWCHNPESKKIQPEEVEVIIKSGKTETCTSETIGIQKSTDEIIKEVMKDYLFYEESNGGVSFSGGEPLMQIDFLDELLIKSKKNDLHTVVDTSGLASQERFERIYKLVDLFLFDVKIVDSTKHADFTGVANELILDNLKFLSKKGKKINIRIPLIPGITDTNENLEAIANVLDPLDNITKINLLPYNKISESKYKRIYGENLLGELETQTDETLKNILNKFDRSRFEVKLRG